MAEYFGFIPTEEPGSYFISYNSEDADRVAPIVCEMHEKGVPLWYDQGLEYGRKWREQIAMRIANCKAVILFATKKLFQREGGSFVQIEYELATEDFGKPVYIVYLDTVTSGDVTIENKAWWHEINHLHCAQNATPSKIMSAIGFTPGGASSGSSMSVEEFNRLGEDYYYGKNGKPQDYAQAVKYYRLAADQGEEWAQNNLGTCSENGHGVPQDYALAVKYYRLAADQGNAVAQSNLGYCYYNGQGVPRDYAQAVKYYRLAANQGNAVAQCNLGLCYENGQGVPQDYAQAAKYYRLAADQGNANGQGGLGNCYYNGQGVPQDYAQAVKYYRLAADQGNAFAQRHLGFCYQFGQGVKRNYVQAASYYRLAADQGNAAAQCNLGWCYESGWGVPKDLNEAIRLYRLAAKGGINVAKNNLRRLGVSE